MTTTQTAPPAETRHQALLRIIDAANRAVDVRAVLEASVREVAGEFGCDRVVVLLPDERRSTLQVAYELGAAGLDAGRERAWPVEGSVYGQVLRSGEPRVVSDVVRAVTGPIEGRVPLRSIAIVPLLSGTRAVGVLSVASARPEAFDGEPLANLLHFAALVGLATNNALLQRASRVRTAQLVALNRLAAAVVGTLSREGVLAAAMAHLEEATQFGAPAIYEIEANGRRLVRVSARGLTSAAADATATLALYGEHTNLVQALQRRRPLLWWLHEEALGDAPALRVLRDEGYRTFIMVPMSARGRLTGAITAASHRERGMDEAAAAILMAIGNQVGTALQNAQLYEALRSDATRLERLVEDRTAALDNRNKRLRYVTSWLSHDLKRPLRSIHALSELLTEAAAERATPEDRDLVERILTAAETMSARLRDLLDFVHIGAAGANPAAVDLERVLDECLVDLAPEMTARGATIVRETRWPLAHVEEQHARHLVLALLENAVRHSRPGVPPEVRIAVRSGRLPACEVRDNGVGVDPELRGHLFHMFPWLDEEGGVRRGTNLFLAREIVETYGGRLCYEPVEPHGSAFLFSLPAVEGDAEALPPPAPRDAEAGQQA